MNNFLRTGGLLVFALVLAGLAGWGAMAYLESREAAIKEQAMQNQGPEVDIVVAKNAAAPGEAITLDNMAIASIPRRYVPQDAVTPPQFKQVAERSLLIGMDAGRPLLRSYISGFTRGGSFADNLDEGERAITIEVDERNAIAGMLQAGDRIDLVITSEKNNNIVDSQESEPVELRKLLENMVVLATGSMTRVEAQYAKASGNYPESAFYGSITVGVPVRLVTDVLLARENDNLHVLLRNEEDESYAAYPKHPRDQASHGNIVDFIGGAGDESGLLEVKRSYAGSTLDGNQSDSDRLRQRFVPGDHVVANEQ